MQKTRVCMGVGLNKKIPRQSLMRQAPPKGPLSSFGIGHLLLGTGPALVNGFYTQ